MKLFKLFKRRSKDDMCEASWYHIKVVACDKRHAAILVANSPIARAQLAHELVSMTNHPDSLHVHILEEVLAQADAEIALRAVNWVVKNA